MSGMGKVANRLANKVALVFGAGSSGSAAAPSNPAAHSQAARTRASSVSR